MGRASPTYKSPMQSRSSCDLLCVARMLERKAFRRFGKKKKKNALKKNATTFL
jgi:hypothetical protein